MDQILRVVIDTNHIMSAILSDRERVLSTLRLQSDWMEPIWNVCTDQSDNRFLECAVSGNADYLLVLKIRERFWKK